MRMNNPNKILIVLETWLLSNLIDEGFCKQKILSSNLVLLSMKPVRSAQNSNGSTMLTTLSFFFLGILRHISLVDVNETCPF